tara:strand:+ start:67 stop:366 length:300 start_codon:yes stop_codon:yes gene_type:complete
MKKILALLLLSPLAFADMDKICMVELHKGSKWMWEQIKEEKCERNNILKVWTTLDYINKTKEEALSQISAEYCRFDRNTVIKGGHLTYVLYSPKRRTYK